MKLSHLLTGAALVALTAGAAVAQVPSAQQPGLTVESALNATDFGPAQIFASETDLSAARPDGRILFQFDATELGAGGTPLFDSLSAAEKVSIKLTLTGGLHFDTQVQDTDFASPGGAACTMVVSAGGAIGSQSVTFETTGGNSNCDDNANEIQFDVDLEARGAGNASVEVRDGNNAVIYTETYRSAPTQAGGVDLVRVASGVLVSVSADTVVTEAEGTAGGAGIRFDALDIDAVGPPVKDAVLGSIAFSNAGGVLSGVNPAALNETFDLGTHASNASFTVTLPSASSFTGIQFEGSDSGATPTVNFTSSNPNSATATISGTALTLADIANGDNVEFALVEDGGDLGTPISFQTPTVSATFTGVTNVNLAGEAVNGAALQTIALEGVSQADSDGNAFRWVGDGGGTDSIFRCYINGTSARVFASLTNAVNGANGTYDLGVIGAPAGELIVTSDMISAVSGAFSRADVTLSVADPRAFGGNGCDRMLLSGAGTLSDFGADYDG
ncbi:hypothetical protein GCM10011367_20970 [Marinicauda pacifica]|nr:hypothetical protein GCM10011367_20970 [Marinicauda pacifica]